MPERCGLTPWRRAVKRGIDLAAALAGLLFLGWLIALLVAAARVDTGQSGMFRQVRIGRDGKPFVLLKIRTMEASGRTTVTTAGDPRITRLGRLLRRTKLDELPQLVNVLRGDMSLVGPRPDVPGFADLLEGPDRVVLAVRPGITGPATLRFRDEERILAEQPDPESYNRAVLFPEKVRLNREYVECYTLWTDVRCLWKTLAGRST
jgi:lipopolysaccharide/colanic/teichoic acid biosynthesis glycosyltransferase